MITRLQAQRALASRTHLRNLPHEIFIEVASHLSAIEADQLGATSPEFAERLRLMYKYYLQRDFNIRLQGAFEPWLYYHVIAVNRSIEYMLQEATKEEEGLLDDLPGKAMLYDWFTNHEIIEVRFQFGGTRSRWETERTIIVPLRLELQRTVRKAVRKMYDERLEQAELTGQKDLNKYYPDIESPEEALDLAMNDYNTCSIIFGAHTEILKTITDIELNLLIFKNMLTYKSGIRLGRR